jgi:hypothetical protein
LAFDISGNLYAGGSFMIAGAKIHLDRFGCADNLGLEESASMDHSPA